MSNGLVFSLIAFNVWLTDHPHRVPHPQSPQVRKAFATYGS